MSTAKRAFVWGWSRGSMNVALERLIDEGVLDIVTWIRPESDYENRPKPFSYIPDIMLDETHQARKSHDVYYQGSDDDLNRDLCKFMDIYSRVNYSKGTDYYEHVNLFHLYYSYFCRVLREREIDIILFMGAPHVGVDYVLYLAARALGVEVNMTFMTLDPMRFFNTSTLEDYGTFENSPVAGQPYEKEIERGYKKFHAYMVGAKHKRGVRVHKFIEEIVRSIVPNRQPISLAGAFARLSNRLAHVRYFDRIAVDEVDFGRPYVYFPLQMQPELTTSTLGREYSDQLLAIEKISAMLPQDWYLYVKENPKQSAGQRDKLFYERLMRIPNCVYISEKVDTFELIEHSRFVSAITGTVCWEAISGGKPALVFGRSWYMTLPGVVRYREGLTLDDILGIEFTHESLQQQYNTLMSRTVPGSVGLEYDPATATEDQKANEELLYDYYRKLLQ